MSIIMFDSIDPSTLPSGAGYAYAGYVDGKWPDYGTIKAKFPASNVLSITIKASLAAECIDVELFDATIAEGAQWLITKLSLNAWRPCVYASVSVMGQVITTLEAAHPESLSSIRIWTAHYGAGKHICGPSTCGLISIDADGTQWTDTVNGISLDESILKDTFFGGSAPPPPTIPAWQVSMMNSLPTTKAGDSGPVVRRVQGLCRAALPSSSLAIDGAFGPNTTAAVKQVQAAAHVTVDGIVGPVTWNVLVTGSA